MLVNCKSESETDIMTCSSIELKVKTHCTKTVGQLKKKSEIENRYHENCFEGWKVKVKTDIVKYGGQLKSEN